MKKNYVMAFISICLLTFLDQFVKFLINTNMKVGESIQLIKGVFSITYVQNKGAAWGSLSGKRIFLLILTIAILIGVIIMYIKMVKQDSFKPLRICAVFLTAGATGNIIDRIIHGFVIDMFDFNLINFPVFNVADIYVTCSVFIILILVIFKYKDEDFDVLFHKKQSL
ncbi:MAG: signal peptidase II [Coprococcus sp.]|nr:signal peptidase II [Coprococcus sp.]